MTIRSVRETGTAPPPSRDDAAVVEALRRGDEEAFARLVDQLQQTLLRIARTYVSSAAIADDVVQDTWLAVIRGLWAFEGRSSLKTWILRILINRSKTRGRREGRTVPFPDVAPEDSTVSEAPEDLATAAEEGGAMTSFQDSAPSPEAGLLTEEARVRIRGAIAALPPNQRVVITMRDLEGCTGEEVCNALGLSETNQRVILHRARSRVRTLLTNGPGER
jgi:RNA polymerase sigma-70 factor (ECF subfamily)